MPQELALAFRVAAQILFKCRDRAVGEGHDGSVQRGANGQLGDDPCFGV